MWVEEIREELRGTLDAKEGACGICHDVLEKICDKGGKAISYERPDGVLARIYDDKGNVVSEDFDIVSAPAILRAELNAGFIPNPLDSELQKTVPSEDDIRRVSSVYGYGRVITPASIVLKEVKEIGGRTVIKREGIGIVARAYEGNGEKIFESSASFCPVCAVLIGATREPEIAERIKEALLDKPNTGKVKYEAGVENHYAMKNGKAFVTIKQGEKILADNVLACCMVYGMVKAEIVAGFTLAESARQFKAYCNICPLKHCWLGKTTAALGNIMLERISELGVEVEVTKDGYIKARIPGNGVIEGRGNLCTLSALTDMLLRGDASKILKPKRGSAPEHEL